MVAQSSTQNYHPTLQLYRAFNSLSGFLHLHIYCIVVTHQPAAAAEVSNKKLQYHKTTLMYLTGIKQTNEQLVKESDHLASLRSNRFFSGVGREPYTAKRERWLDLQSSGGLNHDLEIFSSILDQCSCDQNTTHPCCPGRFADVLLCLLSAFYL